MTIPRKGVAYPVIILFFGLFLGNFYPTFLFEGRGLLLSIMTLTDTNVFLPGDQKADRQGFDEVGCLHYSAYP